MRGPVDSHRRPAHRRDHRRCARPRPCPRPHPGAGSDNRATRCHPPRSSHAREEALDHRTSRWQDRRGHRGGARNRRGRRSRPRTGGRRRCRDRHHRRGQPRRRLPARDPGGTGRHRRPGARCRHALLGIVADHRDIGALRDVATEVETTWGGVDIVFANAGIQAFKPILEMADADWHDQIDNNLTGTANMLRVFAPLLVRRGGGRIIVTSSTQGQHGTKWGSAYSASKWGIIGLMKSAALELGAHGITVNAVIPGLVDTALTRHEDRYAQAIAVSGSSPSGDVADDEATARRMLAAKSPMGLPWIEPEDVAPLVVFLASDEARLISGTSLAVTAGDSANVTA
ncbi:SDR family NAD(P)-dependent oxidoreductase [Microbacterium wangruii]|uniref:SDR family NAD(P)-dependent oxidoreductase n=1 Tax=Microbacterium wangruii TaxID=3049073 RepID=UPI0027D8E059|nr:SDR family NAD(P)-dependent oxidoreductase [Microbacterium sp. zg.Y1090]